MFSIIVASSPFVFVSNVSVIFHSSRALQRLRSLHDVSSPTPPAQPGLFYRLRVRANFESSTTLTVQIGTMIPHSSSSQAASSKTSAAASLSVPTPGESFDAVLDRCPVPQLGPEEGYFDKVLASVPVPSLGPQEGYFDKVLASVPLPSLGPQEGYFEGVLESVPLPSLGCSPLDSPSLGSPILTSEKAAVVADWVATTAAATAEATVPAVAATEALPTPHPSSERVVKPFERASRRRLPVPEEPAAPVTPILCEGPFGDKKIMFNAARYSKNKGVPIWMNAANKKRRVLPGIGWLPSVGECNAAVAFAQSHWDHCVSCLWEGHVVERGYGRVFCDKHSAPWQDYIQFRDKLDFAAESCACYKCGMPGEICDGPGSCDAPDLTKPLLYIFRGKPGLAKMQEVLLAPPGKLEWYGESVNLLSGCLTTSRFFLAYVYIFVHHLSHVYQAPY
ncbi:hypothetical protein TWF173_010259 [Orbilia oligospora]|nr:hypothetical protein TWF173_010259 [Orbilia oligospora]